MRRIIRAAGLGALASLVLAATALATDCTNASRNGDAGAQIIINLVTGDIWLTEGLTNRVDKGLVDISSGEGFHGLAALDFDGDGVGDVTTWVGIGPDGTALPWQARFRGPACRGVTDLETFFEQCLGN
jgi:hypothetical protein